MSEASAPIIQAVEIMKRELKRLEDKKEKLTLMEISSLTDISKTLVSIDKHLLKYEDDPTTMSDEELLEKAEQILSNEKKAATGKNVKV